MDNMKKRRRLENICIILLFIIFLTSFFPWLKCGGESVFFFEFLQRSLFRKTIVGNG